MPNSTPLFRIGTGYDVHRLVEDRDLVLGGVKIPFEKGTLGHSDGDALTHAIADAILGALALGDIGQHFPDTAPEFEGVYSIDLLKHVVSLIKGKGFVVSNVDATLILQRPKVMTFLPEMRQILAEALEVSIDQVSVKATTTEGMGMTGNGDAVAAQAVCLLSKI
ncbi:MAG: 2-C-methyl-D-erythritol 2,4-cyclodiphosphate synthase [Candidatus Marinimicrobia bacterium]|jgi:2-C-methyl-D-erythritol 2,4-cyclodiphosphate synthase|nr:2-C-methyl-D-erythritol 2,4-cyclodiphosphate synthase [Candidatus Neomarinimicrobiota bacterium]MBT3576830.1 2-C-methyl-D-erythritol 2,4-cyclodiphosphate synthase [Candidatus Neomarinimicrobiota bacterium]MBT3679038.1 2-C-methyl-D-erythritol 2,4-cyclodiphosphate synthase [Candidatus Neomarinimicrobiota bacterium]MBT3950295.1 2-C-methyl-D-erythritol 2,4-cyclodiphosphate synthase [Candidatus Neomarinimicrobiota bacterium]MBT4252091.1 2-C-methyl-D-erythritol 2,4-cyclodiphosphate synthase [Candi